MSWKDRAIKVDPEIADASSGPSWKDRATKVDLPSANASEPGTISDLISGLGQGLSYGTTDEIKGALKGSALGGLKEAGKFVGLSPDENDPDVKAYIDARDKAREEYAEAAERSPIAYNAGNLAGGLASSLAVGAGGVAAAGGELGALGTAAMTAGEGTAAGIGSSNAENAGDILKEGATTGAISAGLGAAMPKVTKALGGAGTVGALLGGGATYALDPDADLKDIALGAAGGALGGKVLAGTAKELGTNIDLANKMSRGYQAGKDNVNLLLKKTRDNILGNERTAVKDQADAIIKAQRAATAETEATRNKISSDLNEKIAQQNEAIDKANTDLQDLHKKTFEAVKKQTGDNASQAREQLTQKVNESANNLAKRVEDIRKDAGDSIDKVYNEIEKSDIRIDTGVVLGATNAEIKALSEPLVDTDPNKAKLQKLSETLNSYSGQITGDRFKGLKNFIKEMGFEGKAGDPNIERILKKTYLNLNDQAANDIATQGSTELAGQLSNANKTYSKVFDIENQIGRYNPKASVKAVKTINNLAKLRGQGAKSEVIEAYKPFFNALEAIDPELSNHVTTDLVNLSEQYAKSGKKLTQAELKDLVDQKIQQLAANNPNVAKLMETANLPKAKFNPQAVDEMLPTSLTDKATNAQQLDKLVGSQLPIDATGGTMPSGHLFNMFRNGDGAADTVRREEYEKLLPHVVGEEKAGQLIKNAKSASNLSDLISTVEAPTHSNSTSPGVQIIAHSPKIAVGLGNVAGLATGKLERANLARTLDAMTPDHLKAVASKVVDSMAGAGKSKQFGALLDKASESTDPVRRRAILFTLHQDPDFRKMFKDEDNE